LKVENDSLQARVERSEKYEIASKKAVLDLKTRLRLAIEAEFGVDDDATLVSQHTTVLQSYEIFSDSRAGWNLIH
jgi:hypothetical protein